jgi:hypothetical protein
MDLLQLSSASVIFEPHMNTKHINTKQVFAPAINSLEENREQHQNIIQNLLE